MRYRRTTTSSKHAERRLDESIAAVKAASVPPPTPLDHVRGGVETRLAESSKETIMARMLDTFSTHRRLSFGLAAGLALVLFGALVPLPYSSVVGYSVRIDAPADTPLDPQPFADALRAAGVANPSVNVNTSDAGAAYTVVGLSSEAEARLAARTFAVLTGTEPACQIVPLTRRTSGTLYAQAMERFFRVEVTIDGKTDEQIAAEIAAQVAAQGGQVKEVRFERSDDGQVKIDIEIDSAQ